jgi:hypothetical protein
VARGVRVLDLLDEQVFEFALSPQVELGEAELGALGAEGVARLFEKSQAAAKIAP